MREHKYWTYIVTNKRKTFLYIGVTNNLGKRLHQHFMASKNKSTFAGKNNCYNLVLFEEFQYIDKAIAREKQLKKWTRKKKNWLIEMENPDWEFLNHLFSYTPETDIDK